MQSARRKPLSFLSLHALLMAWATGSLGCLTYAEGGGSGGASASSAEAGASSSGSSGSSGVGGSSPTGAGPGGGGDPSAAAECRVFSEAEAGVRIGKCEPGSAALVNGTFDAANDEDSYEFVVETPAFVAVELFKSPGECLDFATKFTLRNEESNVISQGLGHHPQGTCDAVFGFLNSGTYRVAVVPELPGPTTPAKYSLQVRYYKSIGSYTPDQGATYQTVTAGHVVVAGIAGAAEDQYQIALGQGAKTLRAEVVLSDPNLSCGENSYPNIRWWYKDKEGQEIAQGKQSSPKICPVFDGAELSAFTGGLYKIWVSRSFDLEAPNFEYYLFITIQDE